MGIGENNNPPFTGEGRRLALIIGVDSAPEAADIILRDTLKATADAQEMAAILMAQACGFEVLQVLIGPQATSSEVKKAIQALVGNSLEQDFLLFYFAGHGYVNRSDVYLVTHDFTEKMAEFDEHAHLSMAWLRNKLYLDQNAGQIVLILDSCFSGNMGRTAPDPYLEELKHRIQDYFGAPGKESESRLGGLRQALAATGHGQVAGEREGHGEMTYHLLRALRGKVDEVIDLNDSGNITLWRLREYLQRVMPETQKPALSGDDAGKLCTLARYEVRAAELRQQQHFHINTKPETYILRARSRSFQPRPDEFTTVTNLLFPSTPSSDPAEAEPQRIVGLIGMGGTGKTALAIELAHKYKEEQRFPGGIFWLSVTGTGRTALEHQLSELCLLAQYLPPGDNVSSPENANKRAIHLCRYLAQHPDSLLILDNVDQIDELLSMLPSFAGDELHCTILYTSRQPEAPSWVQKHQVGALTEQGAWNLLLEHRKALLPQIEHGPQNAETLAARAICLYIQRMPLALTLLRDLLQDTTLTLVHLWEEQQRRGTIRITSLGMDIQKARLYSTFMQSWERVTTPEARLLFKLAIFFPEAAPIPLWLAGLAAGLDGRTSLEPLGQARKALDRWSLLEVLSDGDAIRLHPLIREFGQYLIQQDTEREVWLKQADQQLWTEFSIPTRLESRALTKGYWNCLRDVQEVANYARLLGGEHAVIVEKIAQWLVQEGHILGNSDLWPGKFSGLFQQQLWNRALEASITLPQPEPESKPWVRQSKRVGIGNHLLLNEFYHPDEVNRVVFSPNGLWLLTACADGIARLWNAESGELLRSFKRDRNERLHSVAFSPDGTLLATCSDDQTACLWNAATGELHTLLSGHAAGIEKIIFSPDGTKVATASIDQTIRVWNVADGEMISYLTEYLGQLVDLAFSPDGTLLASCDDKNVFLWNWEKEQIIEALLANANELRSVAFSPNGMYIVMSCDEGILLYDRKKWQVIKNLGSPDSTYTQAYFSPDNRYIAASLFRGSAEIWHWETGKLWCRYTHNDMVTSIAFSPDNTKVATASHNHTVRLWHCPPQPAPESVSRNKIDSVQFSPDGSRLLSITGSFSATIWNVQEEMSIAQYDFRVDRDAFIAGSTLSKYGESVFVNVEGNILTWNVLERESQELVSTEQNNSLVYTLDLLRAHHYLTGGGIALSPDEQLLAIGVYEEGTKIWSIKQRQFLATLDGPQSDVHMLTFSPDGNKIITGSSGLVVIWDASTYKKLATFKIPPVAISVASNNALLATSESGGDILLWSLKTNKRLGKLEKQSQRTVSLAFSPNNSLLACGDTDGRLTLWNVQNPTNPTWQGLYYAAEEIGAIHWQDDQNLTLACKGDEEGRPWFYHLHLEGNWQN